MLHSGHAFRGACAAARSGRLIHRVSHEFRFASPYVMLQRSIERGLSGTPRQVLCAFDFPLTAAANPGLPDWFRDRQRAGGWLHNYGSHAIDLICLIVGNSRP